MPFDWNEYLKLAQELLGNDEVIADEDSKRRSAISRAYYSSFCNARNFLKDVYGEDVPEDTDAHRFVKETLQRNSNFDLRIAGTKLGTLRVDRNKADYENEVTGLKKLAELSILNAEQVRESINTHN